MDDVAGNDGQFAGGWSMTITTAGPAALLLNSAVSRKTHGAAGDFDVNLPLMGAPGVECRNGGGNHTLVFMFSNNVVSGNATVATGVGSVSGSPTFSGNTMTVNLTGVTDAQTLSVTLVNVTDNTAQVLPNTTVNVNFLIGDVSGGSSVNGADVAQVKSFAGMTANAGNFRNDVIASGAINAADIGQVKATSGNS